MIRFAAALTLVAALLGPSLTLAAASAPPAVSQGDLAPFFDGMVPYAIAAGDIAGAGIIVVREGKIIFSKGYGFADVAKRSPVIPDKTLFRPGSVSKLFTWTAVMQQVQAGKLNLDTDVNTYLDFKIPPKFGKPITLRNLMTHTGGFEETARDLLLEKRSQLFPIREYLIRRMPNRIYPPGEIIAYSNYGATLAGYIVQRVSGEPFASYVAKHILIPLKMNHSTFVQPLPPRLAPLLASGYDVASSEKAAGFEFVEPAPAGALSSTLTDMAHFMLAYLDNGREAGATILNPATIREMFTLQVAPAPGMNGYDLGFYQENRNGQMIVGHGGDTNVFHSDLHLLPKQHVGIFMSFNSVGKAGAVEKVRTEIFRHFLDRYYPYSPPAEATVASAKRDAGRVSGWYQSSRRIERALRFIYALGQTSVAARPDNTIEVSMLTGPADNPLRWREVGPLYYREVNGQSHLKFTAAPDGSIISWTTDDVAPVFIFQRVNGLKSLGAIKPLLTGFIIVLIVSLLIRLGAWIARRRLHLRLDLTPAERWIHLAARIGAIAFLLALAGWTAVLSNEDAILQSSFVTELIILYGLGVIAIFGGLAMIAETVLRVMHGPGGWLVRFGEIIVGLAAVYGVWFFVVFGLANFVTNF
ncbi:MAG TPA: serine hydrolase domain-containing protein [Candidatus Baltobacteraceae bacterium]|jgi:CubicO group peptidase (beta-lactamase class C family)|nr:serine hydrolase domain-containing protein [Candidatus Baltobacteraceae bacterium]